MRWCQRRALLICGHLRSSRTRSWRRANHVYALLVQPSSRPSISRYRLNRPVHIFEILSFHTMNIYLSILQFVCLQSKWDVLDWCKSSTQHSPPWRGSLYCGSRRSEQISEKLHRMRSRDKSDAPSHALL